MLISLFLASAISIASPDGNQSIQSKNGEFIFRNYPARAKAAGEQGSVAFRAEVDAKGNVMSCTVIGSSGFHRLDDETCDLIVDHARFRPTLDRAGKPRAAVHDGIVNWRLPGVTPAAKVASIGGRPLDEIVCKRTVKTGSLVAYTRVWMIRREWSESAENNQDDWGSLQGRKGFTICGDPPLPAC